jgi:hypothetical protein
MTTRGNKGTRDYPGSSVCNRVSVAAQSQRKCQWSARAVSCWINVRQACVDSRQLLSRDRLPALNDCRLCEAVRKIALASVQNMCNWVFERPAAMCSQLATLGRSRRASGLLSPPSSTAAAINTRERSVSLSTFR